MASLTTSLERLGAALGQLSHAKANFLKNKFPELTYENGSKYVCDPGSIIVYLATCDR